MDLDKMTIAELRALRDSETIRLSNEESAGYEAAGAPFWVQDMAKPVSCDPRIVAIQAAIDRKITPPETRTS